MNGAPAHAKDPWGWTIAFAALFAVLCAVRLTIPSKPMFDEVHYIPAARAILWLSHRVNAEHPPLGKELIALGIAVFGDRPLGWRAMSAAFGTLALFSAMRALWFASHSRFATLAFGVLLITGFPLLVLSRIAMLDVFMLSFAFVGLWQVAGATREPETARWRLPLAGVALGLAMGAKWNAAPVAVLPGLAFLLMRMRSAGATALTVRRGPPIGGITLWHPGLWLGVVPLVVYCATFWPMFLLREGGISPGGLFVFHQEMFSLQSQILPGHTYQSVWWQWVLDLRPIWYLYERVDGAQRGVLMVGNPLTFLLALPALAWCAWAGIARQRRDALAVMVLYLATLALWIVAGKNVQFYYHYALPGCFALAALALALARFWEGGRRVLPLAVMGVATAIFVYYWPILTASSLPDEAAFTRYSLLASWT